MTSRDTRHGRYDGPPGDDREYWMPRDHADWEASWAKHLGSQPDAPLDDVPAGGGRAKSTPESREKKKRHDEAMAYIREYKGTFGLILDIRASERWGTKYMRLSERQVEAVLASRDREAARAEELAAQWPTIGKVAVLVEQREAHDQYVPDFVVSILRQARGGRSLSGRQLEVIERWEAEQHAPERQEPSTSQDAGVEAQPAPGSAPRGDVPDGWYVVDGEPWKVQWNRERTRKYAKRLVDREWQYVPGGLGIVARKGEPMTLEVAQQYGKLYGVCAICGRTLTDEKSIADGIGPVCANNIMGGS